jgi:hypothetical protein
MNVKLDHILAGKAGRFRKPKSQTIVDGLAAPPTSTIRSTGGRGGRSARRSAAQNKPILLSVGYAACHWCHVMAHESFEDEATARR